MPRHAINQHIDSIRLLDYDYSQPGAYFVTLCTNYKIDMFGEVVDNEMHLNHAGEIAREMWKTIPARFPGVELDHFVIMPNHMHGIVVITAESYESKRKPMLGDIIRAFKALTTQSIRRSGMVEFGWQYNYYEHIIRTNHPEALETIRQYIENNPSRWMEDKLNSMPANMLCRDLSRLCILTCCAVIHHGCASPCCAVMMNLYKRNRQGCRGVIR